MKAKELVSIVSKYNPSWTRQGLLDVINYVHRIMVSHPTSLTRAIDSIDNGDPQFIVDLNTRILTISDAQTIEKVYVDKYSEEYPVEAHIQGDTIYFPDSFSSVDVRVKYYKKATEILAEDYDLQVPDEYIHLLEAGVVARIEFMEHGLMDRFDRWRMTDLKRFWAKSNTNFKSNSKRYGSSYRSTYGGY